MKEPVPQQDQPPLGSQPGGALKAAETGQTNVNPAPQPSLPPLVVLPTVGIDRRRLPRRPGDWRAVKWLTPGIGIKRWGLLTVIGLVLATVGAALSAAYVAIDLSTLVMEVINSRTHVLLDSVALGFSLLVMGVVLVAFGLRGTFHAVERAYSHVAPNQSDFLETALRRRRLEHGERVVALGGGTGLSTMLRGLKEYTSNITAVVTMADDGGSSGMLRDHGMLPPGDLRNCIAALAEAEPTMTRLFQHRFEGLGPLKGHSLGNLIVAAMFEMTQDFETAVRETSKVLAIRGNVLPSTLQDVRLGATLSDGTSVTGQSKVNKAEGIEEVFLEPESPQALPGVIRAIEEADVIIIGPGSLFTSIIPNLLVPEIAQAIRASSAPKLYVCNVMTQPQETSGYTASAHVRTLIRHIGRGVITHVLVNNGKVQEEVLERYRRVGAEYVVPDEDAIRLLSVRPVQGDLIDDNDVVRHHPGKLAATIFRITSRL